MAQQREYAYQKAFIHYCKMKHRALWESKAIYSVPNEAKRSPSLRAMMKAAGLQAGVCDLSIDVAHGGYFGLKIEMKAKPNKPTKHQIKFMEESEKRGYKCAVCYNTNEAIEVLEAYLAMPPTQVIKD